ncbi:MAG: hypothetical protein ACI81L_002751 [Verrucomicrobiales bacterium]|jgi:hypothetical protein
MLIVDEWCLAPTYAEAPGWSILGPSVFGGLLLESARSTSLSNGLLTNDIYALLVPKIAKVKSVDTHGFVRTRRAYRARLDQR